MIWDDGDDLHAEPRAPYPHTRETLLLRAEREGAAALVGGFARSVEAEQLLRTGWAHELAASPRGAAGPGHRRGRGCRRARAGPRPARPGRAAADRGAPRGPGRARDRTGARADPAAGYATALACERCRTPGALPGLHRARWRSARPTAPPACRWCGTVDEAWACAECGHRGLRAPVVGETRTAEELGRAFPGTVVRTSGGDRVLATVDDEPAIVVATPGAEPVAAGGYAAVVLLDTWLMLGLVDLRAEEEALRRWANAVGLVRAGRPGGRGRRPRPPGAPGAGALGPGRLRGARDRAAAEAHLPPASRLATITGEPGAVDDALTLLAPPAGRGARPGAVRPDGESPGGRAGAAQPRRRPLRRARRAAAGPLGPQARRGTHPGRPADPVDAAP